MNGVSACAVFLAVTSLVGCGQRDTVAETIVESGPAVSIAGSTSMVGDGFMVEGQQVAKGYGMTYSETALDEVIPALPIFGFANGQPFNSGTVMFRQDDKGVWHMEVSDYDFNSLKGVAFCRLDKKDFQTV